MKEFAYLKKADFISKLNDNYALLNKPCDEKFLVANDKSLNAIIYAPEIDFYIKNTAAFSEEKLDKLYEARAICYDYSTQLEQYTDIKNEICILYDDEELKNHLISNGFKAVCISEYDFFYGGVGALFVAFGENELSCSYALTKQDFDNLAIINTQNLSKEEITKILEDKCGKVAYTKLISFNDTICQFQNRRSEHCKWCVKACPSVALSADENKILISDIDCISCAKCVSICPTNALEFHPFTKDGFWQVSKLYENERILLSDDYSKDFDIKDFLPFHIDFNLLDELYLLHLVNISKKPIAICGEISEFLAEKITLVNDICKAISNHQAIYINANLAKIPSEEISEFASNESNFRLNKRELFGLKISSMLQGASKGEIKAKNYAKISINESTCTLCASCAGACNTNAILADNKTNSIIFNASLCTSCGYCVSSCAEKDTIFMQNDILELNPASFTHQTLAHDELFSCLECGKEFATKKSIEKIASILAASFSADITKHYSLYCCADCKAKIQMLKQAQVFDNVDYVGDLSAKLNSFLKDGK